MTHTVLRLPAVKARTGLSRSTIYLRVSQGAFPAPVSLGGRAVGWLDAEVDAWLMSDFIRNWQCVISVRGPDADHVHTARIADLLAGCSPTRIPLRA